MRVLLPLCATLAAGLGGCFSDAAPAAWPAGAVRGFNIVCWQRGCLDSEAAERTASRAVELGATAAAVVLTWYVADGADTAPPRPHPDRSPTLDELERLARRLGDRGLRVLLKPHVDRLDGGSRTELEPGDLAGWWDGYRGYVLAIAELGQRVGAEALVVGTELARLSAHEARWRRLIADVRTRFAGRVTYAANWDELEGLRFLDALDWVGVDGYYPLGGSTVFDEVAGWQQHLARLQRLDAVRRQGIVFTEIGAPAADDAAQARTYRAALVALRDTGGALFWNLWEGDHGGTHVTGAPAADQLAAAWR